MSRDNYFRFHDLRIDSKRYAVYTQPWTLNRDPVSELSCRECREKDEPKIILSWDKISVFSVLTAIAAHEREFHPITLTVAPRAAV